MNPVDYLGQQSDKFAAYLTTQILTNPSVREAAREWVDVWETYGPAITILGPLLAEHIPGWSLDPGLVNDAVTIQAYEASRDTALESAQMLAEVAASSEPALPGELALLQEAVLAGRVMELEHAKQRDSLEEHLAEEREAALNAASKEDLTDVIHQLREAEKEERAKLEARQAEELRARDAAEQERRRELEERQREIQEREVAEMEREAQERIDREAEQREEQQKREEAAREAQEQAAREAKERAEQEERAREAREEAERAAKEQQEREVAAKEEAERAEVAAKEEAERAEVAAKEEAEREAAEAREKAEQEIREAEERRVREREIAERER